MVAPVRTLTVVCMLLAGNATAQPWLHLDPWTIRGRVEFMTEWERDSQGFPWNASSQSAADHSRLMLDLSSGKTHYGTLYLKSSAMWRGAREGDEQKRLRLEQGDYLFGRRQGLIDCSVRGFANERRFFAHDMIAPLIEDDGVESGQSRGARADVSVGGRLDLSLLHSRFGRESGPGDPRRMSYARTAFSSRWLCASLSYLLDDPGAQTAQTQAAFKSEVSTAYRRAFLVLSYEQSASRPHGVFFPNGHFDWERLTGDGFSSVLPNGAAALAECRVSPIPVGHSGDLKLVWRYSAIGEDYRDDHAAQRPGEVAQTAAAYFTAKSVNLGGRIRYLNAVRFGAEDEERNAGEGGVWGRLRDGIDFLVRGRIDHIDHRFTPDSRSNFVHAGFHYRIREVYTGAHVMWKDVDTIYSQRLFAWDGKLALSPDWGFHWRLMTRGDVDIGKAVFMRLEYRPNDQIFLTFDYGRSAIGDGPFLLEDRDVAQTPWSTALYVVSLRGDF
jgi:hypothetical protein